MFGGGQESTRRGPVQRKDTRKITIPGSRRVKKIEYGIGVSVVSGRYSGG